MSSPILNWEESFSHVELMNQTLVVIGGTDTGKTTWLLEFARLKCETGRTVFVNGDLGQGVIGAPGMLASCEMTNGNLPDDPASIHQCVFIGQNHPTENPIRVLTGLYLLVQEARNFADRILVDTDGLVQGKTGYEYKWHLLQFLKPCTAVIMATHETESLIESLVDDPNIRVYMIHPPESIRRKSQVMRWETRHARYERWFRDSELMEIDLENVRIRDNIFGWGQRLTREQKTELSSRLDIPILYGETGFDSIRLLVSRTPYTVIFGQLREIYGYTSIRVVPIHRWLRRLIGDCNANGFSSGMGYIQGWDNETHHLRIIGRFHRKPANTWIVGQVTYPEKMVDG